MENMFVGMRYLAEAMESDAETSKRRLLVHGYLDASSWMPKRTPGKGHYDEDLQFFGGRS